MTDQKNREESSFQPKVNVHVHAKVHIDEGELKNLKNLSEYKVNVPAVDPKKLCIDSMLYTIEVNDFVDKVKVERKSGEATRITGGVSGLHYYSIKKHEIETLAKDVINNIRYVRINGDILLKTEGNTERMSVDSAIFADYDAVKEICATLSKVELTRAQEMKREAEEAEKFINDQISGDVF